MSAVATPPAVPGVSYRQLDYWARLGYLVPRQARPGTGINREWPAEEVRVAELIGRLRAAGLSLDAAATVARGQSEIAPGVYVLVDMVGAA